MIKRVVYKRLFNVMLFAILVVILSWSIYIYASAQTEIKIFDAAISVLNNLVGEGNQVMIAASSGKEIFNLLIIQITTFLISGIAFIFLLWFLFRVYAIEKMNALIDPLTEIYNRRAIMLGLKSEMERSKRFHHSLSIAIIDIDYFKKYNDKYGHVKGDSILKKVAMILSKNIRTTDVVGRIGGEEFLVLFPETSKEEAIKVCERLRQKVESSNFNVRGLSKDDKLTISLGIGEFNEKSLLKNKEDLMHEADKNLYLAKSNGRNQVR